MKGYNYLNETKCRSGIAVPSGVAPRRYPEMRPHHIIPDLSPADIERFWSKVDVQPGICWEWKESTRHGYGQFRQRTNTNEYITLQAHRVAYTILVGPIPEGKTLDHLCRNRPCCNPDHTQPVDDRTNTLRGYNRAARNARKIQCKRGHELAGDNLRITLRRDGRSSRECIECRRIRNRKRYQ